MFKKIKDKWNKLDEGTKKAVKAGLVVTACAGSTYLSMYIGADIAMGSVDEKRSNAISMISKEEDVREAIARAMIPFENGFNDAELMRDLHDMFTDEFYILRRY